MFAQSTWQINEAKDDNFIHVILGQYKPIDIFFSFEKAMRAVVNTLNTFFFFFVISIENFNFPKNKI